MGSWFAIRQWGSATNPPLIRPSSLTFAYRSLPLLYFTFAAAFATALHYFTVLHSTLHAAMAFFLCWDTRHPTAASSSHPPPCKVRTGELEIVKAKKRQKTPECLLVVVAVVAVVVALGWGQQLLACRCVLAKAGA